MFFVNRSQYNVPASQSSLITILPRKKLTTWSSLKYLHMETLPECGQRIARQIDEFQRPISIVFVKKKLLYD